MTQINEQADDLVILPEVKEQWKNYKKP